jgi:ribosome-associated toxin RatA of RatAB toxin-antitoxin module
VAAATSLLIVTAGAGAVSAPPPAITVTEDAGVYHVAARFQSAQPASVALAVLTDYDRIPRFMPDMRTSTVRERTAERAVVEQEAVARFLMFSRRIHLVLDVRETPTVILFRDLCGRSFDRYEGAWRIAEEDGHTVIRYELTAKPSFDVPEFLLKRLLQRDAGQMIERLQQQMNLRAEDAAPTLAARP